MHESKESWFNASLSEYFCTLTLYKRNDKIA
jgi:hypothetical protein